MKKKSELNSRQWALYNFLKKRGDEWTTQWYAVSIIPEYHYDPTRQDTVLFHDCNARHIMTADIRAINDSGIIQKL